MAGMQPIPVSEVVAYASGYRMTVDELDTLLGFIQYLDDLKFSKRPQTPPDQTEGDKTS